MMNKREFLRSVGGAAMTAVLGDRLAAHCASRSPAALAQDEPFWALIRSRYRLVDDYVNLENGYYSMQAEPVLAAFLDHVREVNRQAAMYMRTRQQDDKEAVRAELATLAGCPVDELVVTRNTTESLDLVISGQDWRRGDQAVMAEQDYPAMLAMFDQQARRFGIEARRVSLPIDPASDDEIVELYAKAITDRTRLLMVCHLVNLTGQILPVRKIADLAHERGVAVMVDGAHSFAHLDFAIPDLGADYYGASLHKWLGCPLGAGLLWVRKDRIRGLWPMFGDWHPDDDIRKLNHTGTHPAHTDRAIVDAIAFHRAIGGARKEARLRHLQRYWTTRVRDVKNIVLFTPSAEHRSCAIATVGIAGMTPADLAKALLERHRIFTVAIDGAGVRGVRVTPHVYTSIDELDRFVAALRQLAAA